MCCDDVDEVGFWCVIGVEVVVVVIEDYDGFWYFFVDDELFVEGVLCFGDWVVECFWFFFVEG